MAEKDVAQDSLLREIDEELRHERYAKLWKKYGNVVVGAALALVVGVAGYKGWQYWDLKTRTEQSERLAAARTAAVGGKYEDARAALDALARDGSAGYALLARFQGAALLAREGRRDEALAAYRALAADGGVDGAYRGVALVNGGLLALETGTLGELEAGIDRLSKEAGPWRPLAREILALAAVKRGDAQAARAIFAELAKDAEAPSGVRTRATEMLEILGS